MCGMFDSVWSRATHVRRPAWLADKKGEGTDRTATASSSASSSSASSSTDRSSHSIEKEVEERVVGGKTVEGKIVVMRVGRQTVKGVEML